LDFVHAELKSTTMAYTESFTRVVRK